MAQRAGFRFAVADDAADEQIGIVEDRAVGVQQRIAEFAAFVDGAGRFGRDVAGNAAGKGELLEQPLHALGVLRDVGIELACKCLRDRCWRPCRGRRGRGRRRRSC